MEARRWNRRAGEAGKGEGRGERGRQKREGMRETKAAGVLAL